MDFDADVKVTRRVTVAWIVAWSYHKHRHAPDLWDVAVDSFRIYSFSLGHLDCQRRKHFRACLGLVLVD